MKSPINSSHLSSTPCVPSPWIIEFQPHLAQAVMSKASGSIGAWQDLQPWQNFQLEMLQSPGATSGGCRPISSSSLKLHHKLLPAGSVLCVTQASRSQQALTGCCSPTIFYLHAWNSCFQLSSNKWAICIMNGFKICIPAVAWALPFTRACLLGEGGII